MGPIAIGVIIGLQVGMWALNKYVLQKSNHTPKPRPDDFDFMQATIGAPLPYVYGTVRVDNAVMIWGGGQHADLVGFQFNYTTTMLIVAGVPSWDEASAPWNNWRAINPPLLRGMWWGDKKVSGLTTLDFPIPHGNPDRSSFKVIGKDFSLEIFGNPEFWDGREDQDLADSDLDFVRSQMIAAGTDTTLLPAYIFQIMVGVNIIKMDTAQVPAIGLEIESLGPQPIGQEANPAWVIYDLLCGKVWKMGALPEDVDLDSFQAAADVLETEGHGISIAIQTSQEATQVVVDILDQIRGTLFENPFTGLLQLTLFRADYNPEIVPQVDNDNTILKSIELSLSGWQDVANQVRLTFPRRDLDYKMDTVPAQRLGNAIGQDNRIRSHDVTFPGITTVEAAVARAEQELRSISRPMMVCSCRFDRSMYQLLPGMVVRANWPQYSVVDKCFRIINVDLGQLADGSIGVSMIEDEFDGEFVGYVVDPPNLFLDLVPLVERTYEEAPHYLCQYVYVNGIVSSLDQRSMAFAVQEAQARMFSEDSYAEMSGITLTLTTPTSDVPQHFFEPYAYVQTDYPRTADPYDTTTGLVVNNVSQIFATRWTDVIADQATIVDIDSEVRNNLQNIIHVIAPGQRSGGELMAFESITDLGGGSYRLNRVWRGLMDTVPVDHLVGAIVTIVSTGNIGRKAWSDGAIAAAVGYAVPGSGFGITGSGQEGINRFALASTRRKDKPLRVMDMGLGGFEIPDGAGTLGDPATPAVFGVGYYKAITDFDGCLDLFTRRATHQSGQIIRGDASGLSAPAGTIYVVKVEKDGEDTVEVDQFSSTTRRDGLLFARSGHGDLRVVCETQKSGVSSLQSPSIEINARRYRDLLANGSFDYASQGAFDWNFDELSIVYNRNTGTNSLQHSGTGAWLQLEEVGGIQQIVDVRGYKPAGLSALLTFYRRKFSGDGITRLSIQTQSEVAELQNDTSADQDGPSDHWQRHTFRLDDIDASTVNVVAQIIVDGSAEGTPDVTGTAFTRARLTVGQFTDQLLANPSFDGASVTSWTSSGTNFLGENTVQSCSDNGSAGYARGGDAATSQTEQVVAIPAGYEYGTAVLEFAWAWISTQGTIGDGLTATVEILDAGSSILAAENLVALGSLDVPLSDVWKRARVAVDLPDSATQIRVRFSASKAGSHNGGAVDDLSLRVHKHLDPSTRYDFDFSEPLRAYVPGTWQAFHLDYPSLSIPIVWGGGDVSVQETQSVAGIQFGGNTHGIMRGWFNDLEDDQSDALTTYRFSRASGSTIVGGELLMSPLPLAGYGKYTAADDFTVGVLLQADEFTWGGACGLVGRRENGTDIGWGLQVDAAGKARASFRGASSEVSVLSSDNIVTDRAPRWVFLKVTGGVLSLH
ncbi:MAG: phage tail protein, partial [Rhodoglobus sp.]